MEKETRETLQKQLGDNLVDKISVSMGQEEINQRGIALGLGINAGELSRFFSKKSRVGLEKALLIIDYLGYEVKLVKKESK